MTLNRVLAGGATRARRCECGCAARVPRYPSDLTDEQWEQLEPLLPVMLCDTELGGRPEKHCRRAVADAILYVADNGCKWRALPADFPPWRTVYGLFARWAADGALEDVTDLLRARVRVAAGRDPEPSAGIVDAQSVAECAEGTVPAATSGYDFHKNVNGRKRHLLTDTMGLLIAVAVTAANAQDRAGAALTLKRARAAGRHRLAHVWAGKATTATGATGQNASSASPSKSSNSPKTSKASRSCPAAGSSSAPTPGPPGGAAAPATTNDSPPTTKPGSTSPPSSS